MQHLSIRHQRGRKRRRNAVSLFAGLAVLALAITVSPSAPVAAAADAVPADTSGQETEWWEAPDRPAEDVELNVEGAPTISSAGEPVEGFIDSHTHLNSNEGFGGRLICGAPFSPAGVADALKDCPDHYPNGALAIFENLTGGASGTHDPTGWPTFEHWPSATSLSHQASYYGWVERAWRSGQRVLVNDLVTNGVICSLPILAKDRSCDEMEAIRLEARKAREMEAYIDGIYGGPGQGFFRIVSDPAQAREVIQQGKLAVVLGVEMSEPFGCKMILDVAQCSKADIDRGLDEFQEMGVSSMFLCHKFDNGLCGVRFDSGTLGTIINVGQFYSTGTYWKTEQCAGPHQDNPIGNEPVPEELPNADPPTYTSGAQCNVRGLTSLGEYALRAMMDRNMMVEVDHMSVKAAGQVLDVLEAEQYPGILSSHSWMDAGWTERVYQLGGFKTGYPHTANGFVSEWQEGQGLRDEYGKGYGFGLDFNGIGGHPGGGTGPVVQYPFIAADGSTVVDRQVSGERVFDINTDGFAHAGLLPDYIEQLRLAGGGDEIVEDLMEGAESYLQTWENTRAFESSQNIATGTAAYASSREKNPFISYAAGRAIDGKDKTRWASGNWGTAPEWIRVDLGEVRSIDRVTVDWQSAAAKAYEVQVSDDAQNWRTVWSTTTGDGGLDVASFESTQTQHVRVHCTERTTKYGYSIKEIGVYAG